MTNHPFHIAWCKMANPGRAGRCERWNGPNGFNNFYDDEFHKWFDGARPARYGDVGIYEPGSFRWTTHGENSREARELDGRMLITTDGRFAVDVVRENGIKYDTFMTRRQRGWTVDESCMIPTNGRRKRAD